MRNIIRLRLFAFAGICAAGLALSMINATGAGHKKSPAVFEGGQLVRPEGFREWIYIGTPLTPNDLNGGSAAFPEFHNVYIDPAGWTHLKKTGEFAEGTMIVKELVSVGSKAAASGKGYFMGEFIGLEAMVKDSSQFADEPGSWAFFSFGHEYPLAKRAKKNKTADCASCHQAQAASDMVFTQYYPVARSVMGGM